MGLGTARDLARLGGLAALFAALFEGLYLFRYSRYQLPYRLASILLMIIVLMLVCYWKGEPPKWRWGDRSE